MQFHSNMSFFKTLFISFFLFLIVFFTFTNAAIFKVRNQCPYTVWAAAVPGGGTRLDSGQSWTFNVNNAGTTKGRVWARTDCYFDGAGKGHCGTGDCGGLLACQAYGEPPNTVAEYALNQDNNSDFLDISLVDGFNVPMNLGPATNGCSTIQCSADINEQCPEDLQTSGGCFSACNVFKTSEFCCNGGRCGPTEYSRFFKKRCPDAYSYHKDDAPRMLTCPARTDYMVVFCPQVLFTFTNAVTIEVRNQCPYTVWAAAVPGGGRRLDGNQSWTFNVDKDTKAVRVWARTNCTFDRAGRGQCETGDCGGLLACQTYGAPPNTLAEFALNRNNNFDFSDISLVNGFNVPMDLSPMSNGCSGSIKCAADINGQCPAELKTAGGCNGPCTVFKTDKYCCTSGSCGPTNYSRFFKNRCPDAYSYPMDERTSHFRCPWGTKYRVVFCP